MLTSRYFLVIFALLMGCESQNEITIVFGGDVMLDRGIRAQIDNKGTSHLFNGVANIFREADFTVINLECPVTDIHSPLTKKFIFRAEPQWLGALRDAGITHCILANNHSYDHGREALVSTSDNLRQANLIAVGYGKTQKEACAPVLLEKHGRTIALFSSVTLPLESWMYLEKSPGMCQASAEDLVQAISAYKVAHPQHLIMVTLHWGVEYQKLPTRLQRTQARALVEAGADAIIGHHPHVVQSFERIDGKPVFYSIGNLVFDNPDPRTHEGILVQLKISIADQVIEIFPYRAEHGVPVAMNEQQRFDFISRLQQHSDPLP